MYKKVVCFVGHRYEWQNIGIYNKLKDTIINLIEKGYTTFYDGGKDSFDNISANIVLELKNKYPQIKLYKILTYYHHEKSKWELPNGYNGSIIPDIARFHPKLKITKKNEWIVNNSDIVVCHIRETYKSGAYNTLKYARKISKPIIYL